jgi:hypothetical protein
MVSDSYKTQAESFLQANEIEFTTRSQNVKQWAPVLSRFLCSRKYSVYRILEEMELRKTSEAETTSGDEQALGRFLPFNEVSKN